MGDLLEETDTLLVLKSAYWAFMESCKHYAVGNAGHGALERQLLPLPVGWACWDLVLEES